MSRNGEELENATRDELYELAREEEIEGRSEMTKTELLEAIQQTRDDDDREERSNGSSSREQSGSRSRLPEIIRTAREELAALLGRDTEGVSSIERDEDGDGWQVIVEVVELERIPSSTDVIAAYAVDLDGDGQVTGYRRHSRYLRSQTEGGS